MSNKSIVIAELRKIFPDVVAAGIAGNIQAESNFRPNAVGHNDQGPGQDAYGLCQWGLGRKTALFAFAKSKAPSIAQQVAFIAHEIPSHGGTAITGGKTATGVALAFDVHFEVSAGAPHQQRADYAEAIYKSIKSTAKPKPTAKPAVKPATKPAAKPVPNSTVTVQSGDTLTGIAKAHNVDWHKLYNANKTVIGSDPNHIEPGQRLVIPSQYSNIVHTVTSGETLTSIGKQYGVDWKAIYNSNRTVVGSNPDHIIPGQRLRIP